MFFCPNCFGQPDLKRRIKELASKRNRFECSYHTNQDAIDLKTLLEFFHEAFSSNYDKGYVNDEEHFTLEEAVEKLMLPESICITKTFIEALLSHERETKSPDEVPFYDLNTIYGKSETRSFWISYLWDKFTESILHEQRFFNLKAKSRLNDIFRSVERQKSATRQSPIYLIEPGNKFAKIKRARLDHPGLDLKIKENPSRELSAPPKKLSTYGRLNASGIPVFYGSFDDETCAAEIRAPVGSIIHCGEFHITAPLCVLDTTLFEEPQKELSIFARHQNMRKDQWLFMRRFMAEISRPITPNKEHLEYVPTQVVAEFLRSHFKVHLKGIPQQLDGVIYSSSQMQGGKNIALFLNQFEQFPDEDSASQNTGDPRLRFINYDRLRVKGANYKLEALRMSSLII